MLLNFNIQAWMIEYRDDYFVLFLLFIISLALFQCFVILPVLYRCAPLFCGVSIVPAVFRCSGGVPCFDIVPLFSGCSMFRCSIILCSGVAGFIACPLQWVNWLFAQEVDSAFHPSEVDKMSTRNFWEKNLWRKSFLRTIQNQFLKICEKWYLLM